jgi:hypothetical protein
MVVIDIQCIQKEGEPLQTLEVRHAWKSTLPRNTSKTLVGIPVLRAALRLSQWV